jgi:hypothetical protein
MRSSISAFSVLSLSDGKAVGVGSTGVRSTDRMEAKIEGDECRWTYEVSKVLQDKRKGTSVVGCKVHTIKRGLLTWEDGKIKVKFSVQVITRTMIIKRDSNRIPWFLHRTKMSKKRAGENS